ncbi:hypothetical protein P5673_022577 [Acropora cervicornis]|uniref:Uncharacterized protein n=1 Tax=Acropora cervicornis TaxID=6130 RepID=A0AAD9Q6P4_ACRCE|nr:hypothetical protein P5673_022577 [Acropora cervicornis]
MTFKSVLRQSYAQDFAYLIALPLELYLWYDCFAYNYLFMTDGTCNGTCVGLVWRVFSISTTLHKEETTSHEIYIYSYSKPGNFEDLT